MNYIITSVDICCCACLQIVFLGHSVVLVEDKMFLFGGRTRDRRVNDLYCLNLKTLTWILIWEGYHPPDPLRWLNMSAHDGILDTEEGRIVPEPRALHSLTWYWFIGGLIQ